MEVSFYRNRSIDGVGDTIFKDEIETILCRADEVANQIIPSPAPLVVDCIPHYYNFYNPYPWSPCRAVNNYTTSTCPESTCPDIRFKKEDNTVAVIIAVVGSIWMLYSYIRDHSTIQYFTEEASRVESERESLKNEYQEASSNPHFKKIDKILIAEASIIQRTLEDSKTSRLYNGLLATTLVAGSVLFTKGFFYGAMLPTAIVGVTKLLHSAFNNNQTYNLRDAYDIKYHIRTLKNLCPGNELSKVA